MDDSTGHSLSDYVYYIYLILVKISDKGFKKVVNINPPPITPLKYHKILKIIKIDLNKGLFIGNIKFFKVINLILKSLRKEVIVILTLL